MAIPSRLIGVLKVEQTNLETKRRERNDRVAVLPKKAPRFVHITSVFNLPGRVRAEIERFFLNAVAFEGKELQLIGWGDPQEAEALVRQAAEAVSLI